MNAEEMKRRTQAFALRIVKFVEQLPKNQTSAVLGKQLLRCGTSVGANYRAACRAKSQADFISKMGIVEEESDESIYWLELLIASGNVNKETSLDLINEANQLVAIVVSSIRTARVNKNSLLQKSNTISNNQD